MATKATPEQQAERDSKLRKAYGAASQDLRENHRAEFNEAMARHAEELGIEWEPKMSAEERAASEVARLFAEFPTLVDRFAPVSQD